MTPDEVKRDLTYTTWLFVAFGLMLIFHVPDYIVAKLIQWDSGININEYYTPHADAYKASEPWMGVAFLALSAVVFLFRAWIAKLRPTHK